MAHDHGAPSARAGARHARRLWIAFGLILGFLVVQVVVGLATGSLALLSDAGHMATDALGLGMALAAITAANRAGPRRATARSASTGSRSSPRSPMPCCCSASPATCWSRRRSRLGRPAARRLAARARRRRASASRSTCVAFLLLRAGRQREPQRRAAPTTRWWPTRSARSASSSPPCVMWATGWGWVDPVVGAAIGLFILPRAWRLGRDALRVLVQAAPAGTRPRRDHAPPCSASTGWPTSTTCTSGR